MTASYADVEFWTAPDGARLALRRIVPTDPPRALVLLFHGFGDHSGRYAHVAEWLAGRGYAVWALDQRGHGRSPGPRGHISRFAQFLGDVAALRKRAAGEVAAPQVLLGHSFGGLVVLRYLETAPQGLAGAVVTSPFIDVAMKAPAWKLAVAKLLAGPLPGLGMSTGLEPDLLSTDPAIGRAAAADPLYHERMTPAAWREIQAAQVAVVAEADRIAVPLLFLLAGDDRIVARPAAEALARALPVAPEVVVYGGMFHEILNERDQARVLNDLGGWLDRLLASAPPVTGVPDKA